MRISNFIIPVMEILCLTAEKRHTSQIEYPGKYGKDKLIALSELAYDYHEREEGSEAFDKDKRTQGRRKYAGEL